MFTLGFDVAKDKLDVALVNRSGQLKDRFLVSNSSKDLSKLIKDVRIKHPKLVAGSWSLSGKILIKFKVH